MSKEHWDKSFSEKKFVYGETENTFLNEKSCLLNENSRIACFAEGEGRNAVYLAKLGHQVTAYDQSSVGLKKAQELAKRNDVAIQTKTMDLVNEKVSEASYDAAVLVYGHVPKEDQEIFLENMLAAVKPGGYVILEVYSEDQLAYKSGGPRSLQMLYDPEHLLSLIRKYKCLHFYYGEVERNEGERHQGLCHVIQVAIKKTE